MSLEPAVNEVRYSPEELSARVFNAQMLMCERVDTCIKTFHDNESNNHQVLINSIRQQWMRSIIESSELAFAVASDFSQKHIVINDDLIQVVVLGAAAHNKQTRKGSGEATFLTHQHRGIALPAYDFFSELFNELHIDPGLAATLGYIHDIREEWAKHFVANNFPIQNAQYELTPDLKLSNITIEFEVADAFVKHLLTTGFRDNDYMSQLANTNDSKQDSIELLTVSPKIKALVSTRQDIDVTQEWISRKVPNMSILELIVKLYDLIDNTDRLLQRPEKTGQRFHLYYAVSGRLNKLASAFSKTSDKIRRLYAEVIPRFWDKNDCDMHQESVWRRLIELRDLIEKAIKNIDKDQYNEEQNFLYSSIIYLGRLKKQYCH